MTEVYRITDRFHLTEQSTVYLIKADNIDHLRINDLLFDLHMNCFKIKGQEMLREKQDYEERGKLYGIPQKYLEMTVEELEQAISEEEKNIRNNANSK